MKDILEVTPYVKIVENGDGEKISVCSQCGHQYGRAEENYKLYCLVHERDPKEVFPEYLAADKDWMIFREFYCPGCGTQVDMEATPQGTPILQDVKLNLG